jgi:hypothetical protein
MSSRTLVATDNEDMVAAGSKPCAIATHRDYIVRCPGLAGIRTPCPISGQIPDSIDAKSAQMLKRRIAIAGDARPML